MIYPNFFVQGKAGGIRTSRAYALRTAPVLCAVGVVTSLAVVAVSMLAALALGPDFEEVARISAWLGLALPLIALHYPAADVLTSASRQGPKAVIFAFSAVLSGFALAAGARRAGSDGPIIAFVTGHAILAVTLWVAAFLAADSIR